MIDFFLNQCQETDIRDIEFGICDDKNNTPAYVDRENHEKWIAVVDNPNQRNIRFTAIDNCIEILRPDGTMDSRCDTMIDYENNIVFIELKDERRAWISEGLDQIEATLIRFIENHNLNEFKHKRAVVANKKHRKFAVLENEQSRRFFDKYKVRISAQAHVVIN